ncbi:MAG: hypothetical protein NT062_27895, partial [Proteobacteria bacterium]|nr:hypothetical protein [Pseudomonadota bacterium]
MASIPIPAVDGRLIAPRSSSPVVAIASRDSTDLVTRRRQGRRMQQAIIRYAGTYRFERRDLLDAALAAARA